MRLLGVYGGIGSPFVLAARDGHEIVGNIEPRSFAHIYDNNGRNTFLENFPGAFLVRKIDEVPKELLKDIDIIAGHPKCGAYSNLINLTGQKRIDHAAKKSKEFLEFIKAVNMIKPKLAFFDNLPKSLGANPPSLYRSLLPDYDISIEYVSNYYYGNSQKNRNRLFIIATLKELNYSFAPGEIKNTATLRSTISDLENNVGTIPNHDRHSLTVDSHAGKGVFQKETMTWEQVQHVFRLKTDRRSLHYFREDGVKKYHFGFTKPIYDGPTPTLIGTQPVIHPVHCVPLTIRERARVMGFPDNFIFYGTRFEDDGTWAHSKNGGMIQQTGRCIPCEFPKFLIDQFVAFCNDDKKYTCSFQRLAKPNKYVQEALDR